MYVICYDFAERTLKPVNLRCFRNKNRQHTLKVILNMREKNLLFGTRIIQLILVSLNVLLKKLKLLGELCLPKSS